MFRAHRVVVAGLLVSCTIGQLSDVSLAQDRSWLAGEPSRLESAIERAMATHVTLSCRETPLEEFAERLEELSGLEFVLDRRFLEEQGLGPHTPVTIDVSDISLRSAIKLALDDLELCWVMRNEVLVITPKLEPPMEITKIYSVADLVVDERGDPVGFKPLLELIRTNIAPTAWDEVGGPATINSLELPGIRAIVVYQSEESHHELKTLLDALRRLKKSGGAIAPEASETGHRASKRTRAVPPAWAAPHVHE